MHNLYTILCEWRMSRSRESEELIALLLYPIKTFETCDYSHSELITNILQIVIFINQISNCFLF